MFGLWENERERERIIRDRKKGEEEVGNLDL